MSVNSYPLFFHTVFETCRIEALVCFHIVQNLPAVFKPDGLLIPVFVLIARRPYSGGKVVQQHDLLLRFNEAGRVYIPYFFDCPKALAHGMTSFSFFGVSMIQSDALIVPFHIKKFRALKTFVSDV